MAGAQKDNAGQVAPDIKREPGADETTATGSNSRSLGAASLQESFLRLETLGREGRVEDVVSALTEAETEFARVRDYFKALNR